MSARGLVKKALSTGKWLRRAMWTWPIVVAVVLGLMGSLVLGAVERALKAELAASLESLLRTDAAALQQWMSRQETVTASITVDTELIQNAEGLVTFAATPEADQLALLQSPYQSALRTQLDPFGEVAGYSGWLLVDSKRRIIGSDKNELVSVPVPEIDLKYVEMAFDGKNTVSAPRISLILLPDDLGQLRAGLPTMFTWSPIRGKDGKVIAVLAMRIPPRAEFTQLVAVARLGETGDVYVVNRLSQLVSESRSDQQLRQIGMLTERESSPLNVSLRDPGVDMTVGLRPALPRSEQPLTLAAQQLAEHQTGHNVDGYRDFRGADVIGAWMWLSEYEIGLIAEQETSEAFRVISLLKKVFWALFALLGAASMAIWGFMFVLDRQQKIAQRVALEAKRLGQYTLDEKLGEGGMGVVYRGHHAMLHRPTAVKFLDPKKTNEQTIARFEREVRLTAKLTHPNTIAVFDYGTTPEGIFYYAMEYLDGVNLEDLVRRDGALPEGRVIHILKQICGSLAEAHAIGLIHRDVKPANIILTCRAGLFDFAKLLDFGLVKAVDESRQAGITTEGALTGTPLYLSPEAINQPDTVDLRTDLYAVGAVGYFLLTGTAVFSGQTVIEILQKHLSGAVEPPSERLGQPVSAELEAVLMKCLQKSPDQRPASASEVIGLLESCSRVSPWSSEEASQCWSASSFNQPGSTRTVGILSSSSASNSRARPQLSTPAFGETIISKSGIHDKAPEIR
ncbi:MAG: serine/threonine protein kinase [Planctomyces sp.]|nr:serine/threonine protein kinase [Planctomyces sp.]